MLHDYFRNRMLTLLKHDNINAKTYCNISSLHLNGKSVTLFNENFCKLFKCSRFRELLQCLKIQQRQEIKLMVLLKQGFYVRNILKTYSFAILTLIKKEYLEPLIRNQFDIFWSVKQNLILVFRSLNLQFSVIGYFIKTEIKMNEVLFFI